MGLRAKPLPPLAELQRLFTYNPETGELTRNVSRGPRFPVGSVAGCKKQFRTGSTPYIQVHINRQHYLAHRICWLLSYGQHPAGVIDHINGDGTDNRLQNLRDVSRSVNSRNINKPVRSATGVRGVSWDTSNNNFVARIGIGGADKFLGRGDFLHCVALRKSAEQKLGYL